MVAERRNDEPHRGSGTVARVVPGPQLPVGRTGKGAPKSVSHTQVVQKTGCRARVRACSLLQRIGEGFGDRGGSEEREGLYYPEKRSGREGWKQASLTAARWPRSTATGSGGGRRRGRSRPAISSRAVAPVQSDGAFASQFENENVQYACTRSR